jgi:hypothetical protein
VILKGLAFMNNELRIRRNATAFTVRVYDESRLRLSAAPSLKEFLEYEGGTSFVSCSNGQITCILITGRVTQPRVFIDDLEIMDGVGLLWSYGTDQVHAVEVFRCRRPEIRVYTADYMLRMAGRPRIPLAACSFW